MELDLSSLSQNQRKLYVEWLAQSNLKFTKKNNQYVAQFTIDKSQIDQGNVLQDSKTNGSSYQNRNKTPGKGSSVVRKEQKEHKEQKEQK